MDFDRLNEENVLLIKQFNELSDVANYYITPIDLKKYEAKYKKGLVNEKTLIDTNKVNRAKSDCA